MSVGLGRENNNLYINLRGFVDFWGKMVYKHVSVRVPWHDNGWNGTICKNPKNNASCLFLRRINDLKDENLEESKAGEQISERLEQDFPPCVAEKSTFMSPRKITRITSHPYQNNDLYKHFRPTPFTIQPYSFIAIPFRWMMKDSKDNSSEIAQEFNIEYDPNLEPKLSFGNSWVQDKKNQEALLNAFSSCIFPQKSLCFVYAKNVPFFEDADRIIIGVGRITKIGEITEYEYSEKKDVRSVLWERNFFHSIREDFSDGFLLPYHELFEKSKADPSIDMREFVALAPNRDEFSYGAEHVSHDSAIDSLLSLRNSLKRASTIIEKKFDKQLKWIDDRLSEIWKARGAYPGLGSVLSAFGIEEGNIIAREIMKHIEKKHGDSLGADPWETLDETFKHPDKILEKDLAPKIGKTLQTTWSMLKDERKNFLKLLSRFDVDNIQAKVLYSIETRKENGIELSDSEAIKNPYLFYERTLFTDCQISLGMADKGVLPDDIIRKKFPLPEPSCVNEITDRRRIRALIIEILEKSSKTGNSLLPISKVIQEIKDAPLSPECPVNIDILSAIEDSFEGVVSVAGSIDNKTYQLQRLFEMKQLISSFVLKRLKGKRLLIDVDWKSKIDYSLGKYDQKDELEHLAREEKEVALEELTESRFSVLVGSAGTGKTTLLSVLCNQEDIKKGGVILLAPTGKARVRMSINIGQNFKAQTIAQFLNNLDRYNGKAMVYHTSQSPKFDGAKTVIVDESSMLTEEQLGALIDSLKGVERFILVGDPRQLPPIGTGRPFVDIIAFLTKDKDYSFPKKSEGYAELTIIRRQTGSSDEEMSDLKLAKWFSGSPLSPVEDNIFDELSGTSDQKRIKLISWSDAKDLQGKLLENVVKELKLKDLKDETGFEKTVGGVQTKDYVYFSRGSEKNIEDWQILSPVKSQGFGVKELNRLIQNNFRKSVIKLANSRWRKIPSPAGQDKIVYGDKVINVQNHHRNGRYKVYPLEGSLQYIANGEIGVVTGLFNTKKMDWKGKLPVKVCFSSQPGFEYNFSRSDFSEENDSMLELAYTITVHKSQGSDFNLSFLVLPNPCQLLSRELLYTSLTRQRDRIILLHQGNIDEFKKFSNDKFSETSKRITNLFFEPDLLKIDNDFYEKNLIHRTIKGIFMRSKSEVVIGNILEDNNIEYSYEKKLVGSDGAERYPDFTIEDEDSGEVYYWEHVGMLGTESYRKKWEKKKKWYKEQDILPFEEGGGKKGYLIVTSDGADGGLDSGKIAELVKKLNI